MDTQHFGFKAQSHSNTKGWGILQMENFIEDAIIFHSAYDGQERERGEWVNAKEIYLLERNYDIFLMLFAIAISGCHIPFSHHHQYNHLFYVFRDGGEGSVRWVVEKSDLWFPSHICVIVLPLLLVLFSYDFFFLSTSLSEGWHWHCRCENEREKKGKAAGEKGKNQSQL